MIDEYEKEIVKLELQIKNLREHIDLISETNQAAEMGMGDKKDEDLKALKKLLNVLNLDLIAREEDIQRYKKQERDKKLNQFKFNKLQEEISITIKY